MAQRTAGSILVNIKSDNKDLKKGLKDSEKELKGFDKNVTTVGASLTGVGAGATVAGAGVLAFAKQGADSFATFGKGIAEVETLIPGAGNRINELKDGVKGLSSEFGLMPAEATKGAYDIISAYGDTNDTLKILEINAKAGKAGLATLSESLALTSAVTKSYGDTSAEAQKKATDLAFTTVKLGQTNFPELAGSIGAVTPLAKNLSLSQEELFATMASLTGVTGNASEVSTQFRGALQALMSPTKETEKLIKKLGFENGKAMVEAKGFSGSIEAITDEAKKTGKPLSEFMGSVEGQTLALALTGEQAGKYNEALQEMQKASGATETAFDTVTNGAGEAAFNLEKQKAEQELLSIQIGENLLPLTLKLQKGLLGITKGALSFVKQNPNAVKAIGVLGGVLTVVGSAVTVIGGAMLGLSGIAGTLGVSVGALAGPIGWVALGIGALVAGGVALYNNWETISSFYNSNVAPILSGMGDLIYTFLKPSITELTTTFNAELLPSLIKLWNFMNPVLIPTLKVVGGIIGVSLVASIATGVVAFKGLLNVTSAVFEGISQRVDNFIGFFKGSWEFLNGVLTGDWDRAWSGAGQAGKSALNMIIQPLKDVINLGKRAANAVSGVKGVGGKLKSGFSGIKARFGFSEGGPVTGMGTSTSDSIPANLSNGEYVVQASAVDKVGIEALNQINEGRMPAGNTTNVTFQIQATDTESFKRYIEREADMILRTLKLKPQ